MGQKEVKGFGYYEMIVGGSGVGLYWEGIDGVYVYMMNIRIMDLEVFERWYLVLLWEFFIRRGLGGKGQYRGGDGVVRDIEFRLLMQVLILSERRVYQLYGMVGGEDVEVGLNLWVRKVQKVSWEISLKRLQVEKEGEGGDGGDDEGEMEERYINMGVKNMVLMKVGDCIII